MLISKIKEIVKAYKEFYPEERLDFQCFSTLDGKMLDYIVKTGKTPEGYNDDSNVSIAFCVVMYYPELTVTNENNKHHTIYDTYVTVEIPYFSLNLGRTTYTKEEIDCGYRHSHVQAYNFRRMSSFCLGDSHNPVPSAAQLLRNSDCANFDLVLRSFIINVDRTIRVESLDGGPYINISSIGSGAVPVPIEVTADRLYDFGSYREACKEFIDYYIHLGLDTFYYDGKSYQLKATDAEFIERVTKAAKSFKATARKSRLYKKVIKSSGLYYLASRNHTVDWRPDARVEWNFKGQPLYLKIKNADSKDKIETVEILDPKIINYIYYFLTEFINSYYATKSFYTCNIRSRAYKIKNALLNGM